MKLSKETMDKLITNSNALFDGRKKPHSDVAESDSLVKTVNVY